MNWIRLDGPLTLPPDDGKLDVIDALPVRGQNGKTVWYYRVITSSLLRAMMMSSQSAVSWWWSLLEPPTE